MAFSFHLRERAARQLVKKSRCCRGWTAWVVTLLLVLSALVVTLVCGMFFQPFVFAAFCALFFAPAIFRARSVLEPIWHPATVVLPKNASLLGLHPDPKPAKCFYISSIPLPVLVVIMSVPVVFFPDLMLGEGSALQWFHEDARCCGSNVSTLFALTQSEWCDWRQYFNDKWAGEFLPGPSAGCQATPAVHFRRDVFDWMEKCLAPNLAGEDIWSSTWNAPDLYMWMLEALHPFDAEGCLQPMTVDECLKACEALPANLTVILKCNDYRTIMSDFCSHLAAVPSFQRCHLDNDLLVYSFLCSSTSPSLSFISCDGFVRYNSLFLSESPDVILWEGFSMKVDDILVVMLGVFCPLLAFFLLCGTSRCFDLASADTAFRFAVYAKAGELQARLDAEGKANLGRLGHFLFRVDIVLVFADFLGDIFAIYTWISTHHPWFAVFQALIILRSLVDIVKLHRREGLINEVKRSLEANTLTDGLYKSMLQEKTVEGTQTSMLLAYGFLYTFDSPRLYAWTLCKWFLSVRSMTNGCFIQFHLVPGDVLDTPLLNGNILGRTVRDTE